MSTLEDHYRRLLAWYPRDHRAAHEDEMVGVLLASSEPGQYKPGLSECADLAWGGLKLHARRTFGRASASAWRDALAVAGVVGTLALLVQVLTSTVLASVAGYWVPARLFDPLLTLVVTMAIVANQRWLAVLAAWALWLNLLPWTGWDENGSAGPFAIDGWMVLVAGTAVVLTLTRSPRRGLELVSPLRLLPWAALLAVVTLWEEVLFWFGRAPDQMSAALPMLALCAIACGYALSSGLGRRSLAILALPVGYELASVQARLFQTPGWLLASAAGIAVMPFVLAGRAADRRGTADIADTPRARR
ncbi:hypothetical protein [Flindersiella endophytica]